MLSTAARELHINFSLRKTVFSTLWQSIFQSKGRFILRSGIIFSTHKELILQSFESTYEAAENGNTQVK